MAFQGRNHCARTSPDLGGIVFGRTHQLLPIGTEPNRIDRQYISIQRAVEPAGSDWTTVLDIRPGTGVWLDRTQGPTLPYAKVMGRDRKMALVGQAIKNQTKLRSELQTRANGRGFGQDMEP